MTKPACTILATLVVSTFANAAATTERYLEEIIVTAQRVEENAQDVPIAMTALSDTDIRDRQIIGISDIQVLAPNFNYTATQPGAGVVSIRGIGQFTLGAVATTASVQAHVNDIPLLFPPLTEYYDLERLEVLRGPQGTLFGRNSTAGTLNAITKRPRLDAAEGYVEVELGNYDLTRIRTAGEVTIGESLGVRIAGVNVSRDGYIHNLAAGDVSGLDSDLDGRDFYSWRITPRWDISERSSLWGMHERIREDDDRVRISNQVCKAPDLPVLGCDPDAFGLDAVNQASTAFGIIAALNGMVPLGARDARTGLYFDIPRPHVGLREQHTDLEPIFELDEKLSILGFEHAFDFADLAVVGSYREFDYLSIQDRHMDVGYTLIPTAFNATGLWPTSNPPSAKHPFGGPCSPLQGLVGIYGGCTLNVDQTRYFTYDKVNGHEKRWTIEAKLTSARDGKLSWLAGVHYQESHLDVAFFIPNNAMDAVGTYGIPAIGLPAIYPLIDGVAQTDELETYALFGEASWAFSDQLKATLGLRYTRDEITISGVPFSAASFDYEGDWLRFELGSWLSPTGPDGAALALTNYYGLTEAAQGTSDPAALLAILRQAPPMPTPGEAQGVRGLPNSYDIDYVTGRMGLDWHITPSLMAYAFYNRGHKPGGFDSFYFSPTPFDDEKVNAFEIGAKATLFNGSLWLNLAAFRNAYDGLQYSQQTTFPTQNIDADIWGLEIESRWRPTSSLEIAFSYGYLDTEINDFKEFDGLDPTGGDLSLVELKDFNVFTGGVGRNYVADRAQVLGITSRAITEGGALVAPGTVYPDGIPIYFLRTYLEANGISTSNGVPVDLDGNSLSNAPRQQVYLGIAYNWFFKIGSLMVRWDYHWQDRMFARPFNRPGDEIDEWSQHNVSIAFTSASGRWTVTAWMRNLENDENVTGQYVEEPVSGAFRNYFLTEPRVYGASLRYDFKN